jgi:hypothetical protein
MWGIVLVGGFNYWSIVKTLRKNIIKNKICCLLNTTIYAINNYYKFYSDRCFLIKVKVSIKLKC